MPIRIECPKCKRSLNAPDGSEGKRAKCRDCGESFVIGDKPATAPLVKQNATAIKEKPANPQVIKIPPSQPLAARQATRELIECPYCSEEILATAKKCKHCQEIIDPFMRAVEADNKPAPAVTQPTVVIHNTNAMQVTMPAKAPSNMWSSLAVACALLSLCTFCVPFLGIMFIGATLFFAAIGILKASTDDGYGMMPAVLAIVGAVLAALLAIGMLA